MAESSSLKKMLEKSIYENNEKTVDENLASVLEITGNQIIKLAQTLQLKRST